MKAIHHNNKTTSKGRAFFMSGFFRHLFAIALHLPIISNGEQETQRRFFGRVLPAAIVGLVVVPTVMLSSTTPVSAASSTLNLDLASDTISVDIGAANANGTFKKSASNTISVTTDHYTGYTLSIKSTDTSASTTSPSLKNGSNTMPSITSSLTEEQFSSIGATNYNNKYGYLPSRICTNTNGCTSNTSFLPAPTLTGDILDKTSSANPTANTYTMAIGARIDQTIPFGSYSNTFEVLLVANAIPYTIIYNDNVVGDMPVDVDTTSATSSVQISSKVPSREGYSFLGWCTVIPTNSNNTDSCTGGDTYAPNATYNLSQTTSNNLNLYAMWEYSPLGSLTYMQDIAKLSKVERYALIESMPIGEDYTLLDQRDNKKYHFSRLCTQYVGTTCVESQVWMTQNLDFIIDTTKTYTHADTDLGWSPAAFDANATWVPNTTLKNPARLSSHNADTNTITGWTNDNNVPYQGEGDDYYVYTSGNNNNDIIYSSLSACTAAHSESECGHYHVGNYYNWPAAVASNNTSSDTTDLAVMPNSICPAGWRLPNGLTKNSGGTTITEFNALALANGITNGTTTAHSSDSDRLVNVGWTTNGFNNFRANPLYFVRSGNLNDSTLYGYGTVGYLWSSTVRSASWGYYLHFYSDELNPAYQDGRYNGFPARCVVR